MSFELREEILKLISSMREDDYWDFKEKFHSSACDLLHDIICMANNRVDRDAYIIFGITDKTFEVVGVENDENRKNQQQMIDFLKNKKFVSGVRPRVEMRTVRIENHEVDVLVIKNSTDTPYFLTEDFPNVGRRVRAYHIYTRVGDTNTDIDKSADINNIEYLWKKRFLMTRSPFQQIMKRIENRCEWELDDNVYYNVYNPEFTITLEYDDEGPELLPEFYAYAMTNSSTMYKMLSIKHFGTQLFKKQIVILDGGRYFTPAPEWEFLNFGDLRTHTDYALKYFIKDSPAYKLNEFLFDEEDHEQRYARKRLFDFVLLFEDAFEKDIFLDYVHHRKDDFLNRIAELDGKYSWIDSNTKRRQEQIMLRLKIGKVLNKMLTEFRQQTNII
ncbi:ATP-binding protein [Paenibacillus sp. FSL R7-0216]|uniref:ATP-binding protein n=1 Tax=Paenibacillus sp. FSL R7-0216 TaxID=2921677 RepID=UPI0030DB8EF8